MADSVHQKTSVFGWALFNIFFRVIQTIVFGGGDF
jgi:hypothetical protein